MKDKQYEEGSPEYNDVFNKLSPEERDLINQSRGMKYNTECGESRLIMKLGMIWTAMPLPKSEWGFKYFYNSFNSTWYKYRLFNRWFLPWKIIKSSKFIKTKN